MADTRWWTPRARMSRRGLRSGDFATRTGLLLGCVWGDSPARGASAGCRRRTAAVLISRFQRRSEQHFGIRHRNVQSWVAGTERPPQLCS